MHVKGVLAGSQTRDLTRDLCDARALGERTRDEARERNEKNVRNERLVLEQSNADVALRSDSEYYLGAATVDRLGERNHAVNVVALEHANSVDVGSSSGHCGWKQRDCGVRRFTDVPCD